MTRSSGDVFSDRHELLLAILTFCHHQQHSQHSQECQSPAAEIYPLLLQSCCQ